MRYVSFPLGMYQTNAYVLLDDDKKEAMIVDPGYQPQPVLEAIAGYHVVRILLTHAHLDHIGGLQQVKDVTNAPIYMHENEKDWLTNPEYNGSKFANLGVISGPEADFYLTENDMISFAGQSIRPIFTPGHTPGHLAFYWNGYVLAGDALFHGSIGRTDLYGGDYDTLVRSIQQKLYTLPDDTVVLAGHGPATTIGREKTSNSFVREDYVYKP